MTSIPPNADELVSAYVDGQAAPDEVALVESNAELMRRVTEMQALTVQLGTPPAPPVDQREAHIGAALDAFDLMMGDSAELEKSEEAAPAMSAAPAPAPTPKVASLDAARERRTSRRSYGLIAAAAAILVFVGLAALNLGSSSDSLEVADTATAARSSDDSADSASDAMDEDTMDNEAEGDDTGGISEVGPSSAEEAASAMFDEEDAMEDESADEPMADEDAIDDEATAADDAEVKTAAPEPAATATADRRLFALGDFDSQAQLDLSLREIPESDLSARALLAPEGLFPRCQDEIPELATLDIETLVGDATVAGELVEIHLLPSDAGGPELFVVLPGTCDVITTVTP